MDNKDLSYINTPVFLALSMNFGVGCTSQWQAADSSDMIITSMNTGPHAKWQICDHNNAGLSSLIEAGRKEAVNTFPQSYLPPTTVT